MYYLPYLFELIAVIDFGFTWLINKLYVFSQDNPSFSVISNLILNNNLVGDIWLIITAVNIVCCITSFILFNRSDDESFSLSKWIGLTSIALCIILIFTA